MKIYLIVWCVLCGIAPNFLDAMVIPFDDPDLALKMIEYDPMFRPSCITESRAKPQLLNVVITDAQRRNEKINKKLDEECVVCLEPYDTAEQSRIKLICDTDRKKITHSICKKCLMEWHPKKGNCPICKRPFKLDEVIKPSICKRLIALFSFLGCFACNQSE